MHSNCSDQFEKYTRLDGANTVNVGCDTSLIFNIILTVHHDKLHNKINEMNFLEFHSDNILYMFLKGKLFIFRRQFYCTVYGTYHALMWTSCYHDQDVPSRWFYYTNSLMC